MYNLFNRVTILNYQREHNTGIEARRRMDNSISLSVNKLRFKVKNLLVYKKFFFAMCDDRPTTLGEEKAVSGELRAPDKGGERNKFWTRTLFHMI